MRISEAAARAGVSTDTVRYYERRRLLPAPSRLANGYRDYPDATVRRLIVIRNAIQFGFSLKEIGTFLSARDSSQPPCRQVRTSAEQLLRDVERQIEALTAARANMRRTLREWDARLRATKPGAPARLLETMPGAQWMARASARAIASRAEARDLHSRARMAALRPRRR
jgi:DNA-binding transcriptional MerR regulator